MKCWYTVGKNGKNMYSIFKYYSIYWTLEMNDTMVVLVIENKGKEEQKKLRKSRVRKFKITYTTYTYWIFPLHTSILLNFLFCKIFQKKGSFILYTYIPCHSWRNPTTKNQCLLFKIKTFSALQDHKSRSVQFITCVKDEMLYASSKLHTPALWPWSCKVVLRMFWFWKVNTDFFFFKFVKSEWWYSNLDYQGTFFGSSHPNNQGPSVFIYE